METADSAFQSLIVLESFPIEWRESDSFAAECWSLSFRNNSLVILNITMVFPSLEVISETIIYVNTGTFLWW